MADSPEELARYYEGLKTLAQELSGTEVCNARHIEIMKMVKAIAWAAVQMESRLIREKRWKEQAK